ncbi:alpha-1,2 mannosyltransferase KTR1 [Gloeopeniophorella convolvens]|nr:alpha-1,2 mannosyltransferase KTR1 [Gloeopeniophorella convolvens]
MFPPIIRRWTISFLFAASSALLLAYLSRLSPNTFRRTSPLPLSDLTPGHLSDAVLLVICQDSDLAAVLPTMQQLEDRFNARAGYTWAFLNDKPFSDEFKMHVSAMSDFPVRFGVISPEHWGAPSWINATRAEHIRKSMGWQRIPHGNSTRFRDVSRFSAGFLAREEILRPYRYYWRIEPGSQYYCNFHQDLFQVMRNQDKAYAFSLAPLDMIEAVYTLWEAVYDFADERKLPLRTKKNLAGFVTDDEDNYNLCYYDNSLEIVDMDFLRSADYLAFFDYLDRKGGIYYERWSGASIMSIALSLFLPKQKVLFLDNVGFRSGDMQHCPQGTAYVTGRCACDPELNFDRDDKSCLPKWQRL